MNSEAKILAVDDVPENLLLLCELLEERGYKVSLASDGELVLNNIPDCPPDLILLDIRLSGINGYEVCSRLKANPKTQHIPIIFLSVLEDPRVKVKAFKVGGADYITKPFQEEEVIARIENHLTIQRQKEELEELQAQLINKNTVLAEQNKHLNVLLQLTKLMNTAESLDEAIAQLLPQICKVIAWDYGEAWILNPEGTKLERSDYFYVSNPDFNWLENSTDYDEVLAIQSELVESIAHSKKIQWLSNISDIDTFNLSSDYQILQAKLQASGLTSLLGLPIIFKEEVLAVLIFMGDHSSYQEEGASVPAFSPDWLDLIQSVGTQLGALMQRLRTEIALKKANEKLQHLVAYDGLMEIANRRRFDEYLDEQWRQGKRDRGELSLVLCDLDAFKAYNDTLGHQAGDKCLQQVAKKIQEVVKRPMDLVARYGGEELAILLPYTCQIGAFQLAEQIRGAVKSLKIEHPKSPVSDYVTVSIGVSSIIPRDDCAPKQLIRMADKALYKAKEMGRDQVVLNNQSTENYLI
ncbi:diguanylate cyclase [Euhalothece natronophila Z-M001]|uniref:Diguanylate cyclase n=1 Tax=Euhalothece natronophila Z-M001 TaxID=522448 RepID=A0A5B8NLI7_9CHRO|nr:diguanylate cyclase [Euhalothece natronophila]QDZ39140.1 diguanylate cyclase [Euhalothece natronophila Z-M001]